MLKLNFFVSLIAINKVQKILRYDKNLIQFLEREPKARNKEFSLL